MIRVGPRKADADVRVEKVRGGLSDRGREDLDDPEVEGDLRDLVEHVGDRSVHGNDRRDMVHHWLGFEGRLNGGGCRYAKNRAGTHLVAT